MIFFRWKIFGLLVLINFISFKISFAQYYPELKFQKFFGTIFTERPYRIVRGAERDLFLVGATVDTTHNRIGNSNGVVYKCTQDGEFKWSQIIKGNGREEIRDACYVPITDELYFTGCIGTDLSHPENGDLNFGSDYLIGKLNATNGKLSWKKSIGGSEMDCANAIVKTWDDGCIVVGNSWSNDGKFESKFNGKTIRLNNNQIVGLNKFGTQFLNKCWGGNKNDWATTAFYGDGKSLIIAGVTTSEELDYSRSRSMGDVWIQKWDSSYKILWTKILKESHEDKVNRVIEGRGGFIYAVGTSYVNDKDPQFWFIKLTEKGETVINKKWGSNGVEELTSIYETFDGGLILTGYSFYTHLSGKYLKGGKDLWVIRLDNMANIIWQKTYGGPKDEVGVDVIEGADHEFYILGQKENRFDPNLGTQKEDFWILKIVEKNCSEAKPFFVTDLREHLIEINDPVKFINQSKVGDSWLWDFGDGTTSTEKMPVKVYKKPGNYLPRLTCFVNENCIQTFVYDKAIQVQ